MSRTEYQLLGDEEREARIRARKAARGTPEWRAAGDRLAAYKARVAEQAAALEAAERKAIDEWCRRFDGADLRTQALLLAEQPLCGEPLWSELRANLLLMAKTIPAGVR